MALLEVCSFVIALAAIAYTYFKLKFQYWKKKGVPYVTPTVPYGSYKSALTKVNELTNDITASYNRARENNWKYIGTYNLASPSLIICDLDLLKHIMTKDFDYFTDRGFHYDENQPISAHLFAIGGTKWKNLRVKLTPTFTSGKMKMMFQTLTDCGVILEKHINDISNRNQGVDIKNILASFTIDVIGSVAFGLQCNAVKEPNSDFRIYGQKAVAGGKIEALRRSLFQGFPRFTKAIGLVPVPRDVEYFFNNIVKQTVAYREKSNVKRADFLQILIDMKKNKAQQSGSVDNLDLTMDEIIAQSFLFFLAGFETSSSTMTFALYELANHPKIQEKVRNEIHTTLKKHNDQITYESLKEMEYLQQVIDEALRMYAVVPLLTRECVKDYKVPDSDLIIEKGTKVIIPVRAIHYDESIYPNPKVFDPDRFSVEQRNSRHQYAHLPFGEGPRICIGMRFGVMQSKLGLVSILRNHKVTLNDKTQTPLKLHPYTFLPLVKDGIWLNIEKA